MCAIMDIFFVLEQLMKSHLEHGQGSRDSSPSSYAFLTYKQPMKNINP